MKTFQYWNNKEFWHQELIFSCVANSISDADELLEKQTGIKAIKCSYISCVIIF